jgi:hypothetical protein
MTVQDESLVVSLIQRHLKYTKSAVARAILNDWQNAKPDFVKVFPHEYARALREKSETEVRPLSLCLTGQDSQAACEQYEMVGLTYPRYVFMMLANIAP